LKTEDTERHKLIAALGKALIGRVATIRQVFFQAMTIATC